MSSLPQQTRFRLNVSSASYVVVLFGLLLMKSAASVPIAATTSTATTVYSTTAAPIDNSILLFEDSEFKGIRSRLFIGLSTCVNLIGKLNDFFSSVDTMGGCYLLCEHQNCRGKCERVTGRVTHLSRLDLNDRVSSLKVCDDNDDKNTAGESSKRSRRREAIRSSSPSPVFLRRRLRRSIKSKPEEEPAVSSSSFSSNLRKWRTMKRRRTVDDHHHHPTSSSSSDHPGTLMPSPLSLLNPSPIKNLSITSSRTVQRRRTSRSSDEEDSSGVILKDGVTIPEEWSPRQRLLRIPRHRRKRKGLIVRK